MNRFKETFRILKSCICGNRFNLTDNEKNKFDNILLYVIHNQIDFKNDEQKDKFIKKVFGL